ncbi:MAG: hypothetical protein SGI73_19405 [Chloroflexota bacterium]|nr:hypothetical protein [Chloroflexota bacterium]
MDIKTTKTDNPMSFGMALVAGIGLTVMIVALAMGVVGDANSNTSGIGVLFLLGLVLLIIGVAAWIGVTRPFAHFDDISKPLDDGHGHAHVAAHDDHPALEAGHDEAQPHALPSGGMSH